MRSNEPLVAPDEAGADESRAADADPAPAAERIFFAALPLEATAEVAQLALTAEDDLTFAKHLRLRLHVMRGYKELGEMTKRSGLPLVNGIFQMSDLSHITSHDRPGKVHRRASFVVDYDEQAVDVPTRALESRFAHPLPQDVAAFVSEYIVEKSYQRAFDVASRVAASKAGDCTEHAVLTTALLRRSNVPARVVLGIVLLAVSNGVANSLMAVGHSWVEYHDGSGWQVVDAALRPDAETAADRAGAPGLSERSRVRMAYLPIRVIEEEGVGFARALMDGAGVESVVRVELDVAP